MTIECATIWPAIDHVEVDGDAPEWCVNHEWLDADSLDVETTESVSRHATREEALAAGRRVARAAGLPLYEAYGRQCPCLLEPA